MHGKGERHQCTHVLKRVSSTITNLQFLGASLAPRQTEDQHAGGATSMRIPKKQAQFLSNTLSTWPETPKLERDSHRSAQMRPGSSEMMKIQQTTGFHCSQRHELYLSWSISLTASFYARLLIVNPTLPLNCQKFEECGKTSMILFAGLSLRKSL